MSNVNGYSETSYIKCAPQQSIRPSTDQCKTIITLNSSKKENVVLCDGDLDKGVVKVVLDTLQIAKSATGIEPQVDAGGIAGCSSGGSIA